MTTNRRNRRLFRDPDDKMIGGVCSGLGHYFDVDPALIRVGFVVVALLGGGGGLAYLLLWAILDPAPPRYWDEALATGAAAVEDQFTRPLGADEQVSRAAPDVDHGVVGPPPTAQPIDPAATEKRTTDDP